MGLLTNFLGLSPEQTQGLMGLSAALAQSSGPSDFPTSGAQGIAAALQGYQHGVQGYQDRQRQQTLHDLRLRGMQGELGDQERARSIAQQIEEAARASNMTPEQQALAGGGGPTAANAARIPDMKGDFDTEGFLNKVMGISPLQGLEYRKMLAKAGPKFDAGITWVNGPDGKPMAVRTADDGSIKQLDGMTPREKLHFLSTGGKTLGVNENTGEQVASFANTVDPNTVYTGNITMRGQNLTDSRERQQFNKPVYDAERGVLINTRNGIAAPIQNGDGTPLGAKDARQKITDARDVLSLLDQAEPLIDKATHSYAGMATDQAARFFGSSTEGANAGAQLQALEGALVSKMPKMSGPQSDKDVLLYRQMAGQIGDPTLPPGMKKAAMSTIRAISRKYLEANHAAGPATPGGNDISALLQKYGGQ